LNEPGRAVVISAGNGRKDRGHCAGSVKPRSSATLRWVICPGDLTQNFVEIWYPTCDGVSVSVIAPDGDDATLPVAAGTRSSVNVGQSGHEVGLVIHASQCNGRMRNQVVIALHPSRKANSRENWQAAPDGVWQIEFFNGSDMEIAFQAVVERDDRGRNPRVERSWLNEFNESSTIGGNCTGFKTIVVGAYNTATQKVLPFSAIGPTLDYDARPKPDIYAPGATDLAASGVLAARALSARPIRLLGTSTAAAHVSGVVALLFDLAQEHGKRITSTFILSVLKDSAVALPRLAGHLPAVVVDKEKALSLCDARLRALPQ
jgi:subtilisin family serine protease